MDAKEILEELYAQFPGMDPRSDDYDSGVNGGDLVDWLTSVEDDIVSAIEG